MTNWTAGYVADIGYTYGYYEELNPQRIKLALLKSGFVPPTIRTACELGFGQGLSANLHAAASDIEWYGTDFNPSQAAFAQELAIASGSGAKLYDDSFADFARRDDLPDFDYIGLHGIWSWISDENRAVIVDFVRRKLKVGGVLYISYNTLPGWAAFAPLRHLMTEHSEVIGAEGRGIVSRIDDALDFADKMLATNPAFARANPLVAERVKAIKGQSRHYLAHEYFNRDWHPMHFSTMAEWLEPAKLSYACSATFIDHIEQINLTEDQQNFLKEIPDAMFRESVRDFMVNQQFRRDYWIKGPRSAPTMDRLAALRALRLVLVAPRADVPLKMNGVLGEAQLAPTVYNPYLDLLADHKVKTFGEICDALVPTGIAFPMLMQATLVLVGGGHVMFAQNDDTIARARAGSRKLNDHLINIARSSTDISNLASPVTGGGIPVGRINQLFIQAIQSGMTNPADYNPEIWKLLSAQNQRLIKDGQNLMGEAETLEELKGLAASFHSKIMPIMKALHILD